MKSRFFDKIDKISKLLASLPREKGKKIQTNEVIDEKWNIMNNMEEIQTLIKIYYKYLYFTTLENQWGMDGFPDIYDLPRFNQEEVNN